MGYSLGGAVYNKCCFGVCMRSEDAVNIRVATTSAWGQDVI